MFVHKNFPKSVNTKILPLLTMSVSGLKFSWISPFSVNTKFLPLITMCVPGLKFSGISPFSANTKILPLLTMMNLPPSLTRSFEIRVARLDRLFWSRPWACSPRVLPADTKGDRVVLVVLGSKSSCSGGKSLETRGFWPALGT